MDFSKRVDVYGNSNWRDIRVKIEQGADSLVVHSVPLSPLCNCEPSADDQDRMARIKQVLYCGKMTGRVMRALNNLTGLHEAAIHSSDNREVAQYLASELGRQLRSVHISANYLSDLPEVVRALAQLPHLQELSVNNGINMVAALAKFSPVRPPQCLRFAGQSCSNFDRGLLLAAIRNWCGRQLKLEAWITTEIDVHELVVGAPAVLELAAGALPRRTAALLRKRQLAVAQLALVCGGSRAQPRLPPELHQLIFEEFVH